jgi:hypothetical protein
MRLNFNKYVAITVTLLCFSHVSFAGTVVECSTKDSSKDYGDATVDSKEVAYGEACHETNAWQQLGSAKITNPDYDANDPSSSKNISVDLEGEGGTNDATSTNNGWNADFSQNDDTNKRNKDTGDNGVRWRVANDDGTFSGKYRQPELTQGQAVQFKFTVTRSNEGNHKFDELKVWVDWNGQDGFNNNDIGKSGSEILYNAQWYKHQDKKDYTNSNSGNANSDVSVDNNKDTYRRYILETAIPLDAMIGDTWMRARIVCENSLNSYSEDMNLLATGYQDQGEVEDYKLTINQVPEPTTILVFGSALIGLVLSRKKTK